MFVTVDNATNTFFSDNPYYFYNDPKSPRTPDSQTSNKGFSIFKRRNSKGSSPRLPMPEQTRLITSANLDTTASLTLGSPRASFGFAHQSFELQPLMLQQPQQQSVAQLQTQITASLHQRRQRSSNSHSETIRDRLGSCNETSNHNFEHDDVFSNIATSPSKHHHTLPSTGVRRHSFGNWRQASERHGSHKSSAGTLTATDEVPQMMAPRPPVLSPNKYRGAHRRRANYRLNKESFRMVLDSIEGHLSRCKILPVLQLAASLRFLAEGSYQRSVGNDLSISLGRSTISTILGDVINVMERFICPQWIQLEMDSAEKSRSREYFYSKYKIPTIIGCIDGTHVKIIKPRIDEHLYFNRKGYYSMNAMIICDGQMKIRAVDARYPGCSHDAFVWNVSSARQHFLRMYESGDRTSKLLGDCGYGIEPFLLTPYRDPRHNSQEYKFNMAHASARNIVERTIGVLKSRFRCLMSALHYRPEKVVKIINVCCALHNICRNYKLEHNENDNIRLPSNDIEENVTLPPLTSQHSEALRIRDEISNTL